MELTILVFDSIPCKRFIYFYSNFLITLIHTHMYIDSESYSPKLSNKFSDQNKDHLFTDQSN
jgi:hypothetical protein